MEKAWEIIKTVIMWIVIAAAVFMMVFTIISAIAFDRNDRNLLGYKFYIVQSDSMAKTDFKAGDIIISRVVDPTTLQEGDIITFISQNPESYGETITHKIRRLTTDANGEPGFVTYGTTTDTDDETVVTYPYVMGQYQVKLSGFGTFFAFLKTTPGYIVCIFVPFLLLILYNGINAIRLFRQYKAEQMNEVAEERRKLEEERRASMEMMAKLQQLQQQLASQAAAGASAPEVPAAPAPAPEAPADD